MNQDTKKYSKTTDIDLEVFNILSIKYEVPISFVED